MKNFFEEKKKLEEEYAMYESQSFAVTLPQIALFQAMMFGMVSANQQLLKKIIKELKIELKDDDGNIVDVNDFCEFHQKAVTLGYFKNDADV